MKSFYERTKREQEIISKAYQFEIFAIKHDDCSRNPFFDTIKSIDDVDKVWEAINLAVELRYL